MEPKEGYSFFKIDKKNKKYLEGEYELGITFRPPYKLGGSKTGNATNGVKLPEISLSRYEIVG